MTVWWFGQLDAIVPSHLISVDDPAIPSRWQGRAMLCTPLQMVPVEAVARGYLTGSGLLDYQATGEVCGISLPAGLVDGDQLPEPIFTPATKAALGEHDENVSYDAVVRTVGAETAAELQDLTMRIYAHAAELARGRGIILADTKFEFGRDTGGRLVLADEVLTPDSSRFWPADEWQPGRAQPSFDKQYVRNWLLSDAAGWDRGSGAAPPPLPDDVVAATRERYVEAYERLTGRSFADWPG
jgi:phosphoribosylaminoimidazole-succinocarboxamide synthase